MKLITIFLMLIMTPIVMSQQSNNVKLKKGRWVASLQLNENDVLPFELEVKKEGKSISFVVVNGEEMIEMDAPKIVNDSIHVRFPYFNSELVFSVANKKTIKGYWQNFNKGTNYTIDFTAFKSKKERFESSKDSKDVLNVNGKWQVAFEPGTDSEYPAVGIFKQNEKVTTGTFLTETGDYRYLAGNTTEDSLLLSCFDGSHAFLFKAKLQGDSLSGKFFSGSHWQNEWTAKRNDSFELTSPEDLTHIKEGKQVSFELKNLINESVSFPNESTKDKVVIIQIMGTWCPNCLDETMYYQSLSKKYGDRGLEIVSVCYEIGDSYEKHVENIERLKDRLDLDFTFLVGGNASKSLASEHFNMLNHIISFPTSIFIGRDGEVKRVHTGFNGPGTGSYYTEYVESTNALIEYLLAQ